MFSKWNIDWKIFSVVIVIVVLFCFVLVVENE